MALVLYTKDLSQKWKDISGCFGRFGDFFLRVKLFLASILLFNVAVIYLVKYLTSQEKNSYNGFIGSDCRKNKLYFLSFEITCQDI